MKKYIAPVATTTTFEPESQIMNVSVPGLQEGISNSGSQLSNGRDDDFNSWED